MATQFLQRAADAFLCGVIAEAEGTPDGAKIVALEETEQQCFPVVVTQVRHRFVEDGTNALPFWRGVGSRIEVLHSEPFAGLTAMIVAPLIERGEACAAVEPAEQRGFRVQRPNQRRR